MKDATHIYCDLCKQIRPVIWRKPTMRDISGKYTGADGVCSVCKFSIVTLYREAQEQ